MKRCAWVSDKQICRDYHDNEWGKPVYDDKVLFEFLVLESFQAGLSWNIILQKRNNFKLAFDNFDFNKIVNYNDDKINELLNNKNIVRNKLKINSVINNAKQFIKIKEEYGSFSKYIWNFVGGQTIVNKWKTKEDVPVKTDLSIKISNDLKKKGFKFVGATIIYSFMQAVGIVDDHEINCSFHTNNKK